MFEVILAPQKRFHQCFIIPRVVEFSSACNHSAEVKTEKSPRSSLEEMRICTHTTRLKCIQNCSGIGPCMHSIVTIAMVICFVFLYLIYASLTVVCVDIIFCLASSCYY